MPMPYSIWGSPAAASLAWMSGSLAIISHAQRTASRAWPSWSWGAFQKAMISSPTYLSRVPSQRKTTLVSSSR